MPEPTNAERAAKAKAALYTWRGPYVEDESDIQDLISDLLHLAAKRRYNPRLVGFAVRRFSEETKNRKWLAWADEAGGLI